MVCWLITKLYGHHQRIVRTSRERRSIRNEKKDGTPYIHRGAPSGRAESDKRVARQNLHHDPRIPQPGVGYLR
jgi:hypothetical protein